MRPKTGHESRSKNEFIAGDCWWTVHMQAEGRLHNWRGPPRFIALFFQTMYDQYSQDFPLQPSLSPFCAENESCFELALAQVLKSKAIAVSIPARQKILVY